MDDNEIYLDGASCVCVCKNYNYETKNLEISLSDKLDENLDFIRKLNHDPSNLQNWYTLEFLWDGLHFNADVFNFNIPTINQRIAESAMDVTFQLGNIQNQNPTNNSGTVLFYIPELQLTHTEYEKVDCINCLFSSVSLDKTPFIVKNKNWCFRDAYTPQLEAKGIKYPYNMEKSKKGTKAGTFLEVDYSSADELRELKKIANSICKLTGFAYGKNIAWTSSWIKDGETLVFDSYSVFAEPSKIAESFIVSNGQGGRGFCVEKFIDCVFDEFDRLDDWWSVTLHWFLLAKESHVIELHKMVEGMLFDRLTNQILSSVVLEATGLNLEDYTTQNQITKNIKPPLERKLNLAYSLHIDSESVAFMDMCSEWIKNPTYITKIKSILKYAGLTISSIEEDELKKRHKLVHCGDLSIAVNDVLEYDSRITKLCLLILLSMLGYGDSFNTRIKKHVVSKELPNWERLRLCNIEKMAQSLLR